jgi:hypothetical protein
MQERIGKMTKLAEEREKGRGEENMNKIIK